MVDPLKKAKAPLFDHAKVAAALTVDHAAALRRPAPAVLEPQVREERLRCSSSRSRSRATPTSSRPRRRSRRRRRRAARRRLQTGGGRRRSAAAGTARRRPRRRRARTPPRNRTLRFEYDMASGKVTLNEDYVAPAARPRWVTLSPDEQTVLFARNHNLYMMDAANYAKAQKNANDASIVETKLTTDGEEYYSYARSVRAGRTISSSNSSRINSRIDRTTRRSRRPPARRTRQERPRARRQHHLVAGLEEVHADPARRAQGQGPLGHQLAVEPAADARDLPLRDARRGEHRALARCTSSTSPAKKRVTVKADRFKDQSAVDADGADDAARARGRAHARRRPGPGAARAAAAARRRRRARAFRRSGSAQPTSSTSRASAAT